MTGSNGAAERGAACGTSANATPVDQGTLTARARRLRGTLHDLGLVSIVPEGWARVTPDGIQFADLPGPAADRFVRALEDLGRQLLDAEAAVRRAGAVPSGGSATTRTTIERRGVHLVPPS